MRFCIETREFLERDNDPLRIAAVGTNGSLTWAELERKTSEFRKKLESKQVVPNTPIGIYGHKQVEYMAAVCACIQLKCPYVPMDEIYPSERIQRIQEIAGIDWQIDLLTGTVVRVKRDPKTQSFQCENDLIYIIFTSGSTGEPKGVQISLGNVLSLLRWMKSDFAIPEDAVFMNQAPFSFDLSVYELMFTLHFGKTIVMNSREQVSSPTFLEKLNELKVNTWVSTPSFAWAQCINQQFNSSGLSSLKCFLFCGEVLPVKLAKKLRLLFPEARILNSYGPTEATVATTLVEITDDIILRYETLPVGYAKSGTRVYADGEGQIRIVGDNVMRGYLNRPDLNLVKLFDENGIRGFATGDLGYEKDGLIFCNGRMDDQIKLHGYRIELSEIDHALTKVQGVAEAACVPVKRGEEVLRLIAFLKFDQSPPALEEFKIELSKFLPYYMIPGEFYQVNVFPVNVNNKIDRSRLLADCRDQKIPKWM